jgi:hypothetical protein
MYAVFSRVSYMYNSEIILMTIIDVVWQSGGKAGKSRFKKRKG